LSIAAVYFPIFTAATMGHDALVPLHDDEQAASLNLKPPGSSGSWPLTATASPPALLGYRYGHTTFLNGLISERTMSARAGA
jgi:hypothetical protein